MAAYHLLLPAALIAGLPARVVGRGYLAVDIFFVLSGYVMALTYGGLFAGVFRPHVFAAFLWRRLARLYPIYGTIVVGRLVYTAWRYGTFDLPRPWIAAPLASPWVDIPANLLLIQSWGVAPSSLGPAWSISTEWAAYAAFPLLAGLMLHGSGRAALCGVAICLGLLLATASLLPPHGQALTLDAWDGQTAGPLMRCFAGFILGLGVWRLSTETVVAPFARSPAALCAVLLALGAGLAVGIPDLALYPLFPALVLCLSDGRAWPARWFGWRPVVWLGEISYSLYLLHIFLLNPLDRTRAALRLAVPPAWVDLLTAVLILAALLAASFLCYRCIERPGRRLLTRAVPL